MRWIGLLLVVGSASGALAQDRGRLSLASSLRAQGVEEASGADGQFTVRYGIFGDFAIEGIGRSGWAFSEAKVGEDVFYVGLLAGLAYAPTFALDSWSPRAALRLTHIHHALAGSWADTPGANLAGDSSGGVQHRSGLEAAVGVGAPGWRMNDGWGTGLDLELTVGYLPSSDVLDLTVGLGVGLAFFTLGG